MDLLLLCLILMLPSGVFPSTKGCIYRERMGTINCRGLGLTDIPMHYLKNKTSHTLDLGFNNIASIDPKAFLDLEYRAQIETLFLYHNQLENISRDLFTILPSLKILDISYNRFTSVPRGLCHLDGLVDLSLAGNPVKTFSKPFISCFPDLKLLSLANCNLTSRPEMANPLVQVDTSGNNMINLVKSASTTLMEGVSKNNVLILLFIVCYLFSDLISSA